MKLLIFVAVVGVIILAVGLIALSIYALSLRRRLGGLDDPELWLTRKERRQHAKKLLQREQEQYDLTRQHDLIDTIRAELTPHIERNLP